MRGRAILADEVGLGKTVEAGIVLKELLVRGLARKVLILTPASLVTQWRGGGWQKFGIGGGVAAPGRGEPGRGGVGAARPAGGGSVRRGAGRGGGRECHEYAVVPLLAPAS